MERNFPLADRAAAYNSTFPQWPDSHLHFGKRMIGGTFVLGNDYRNRSRLYGAYPPNYLRRILALFPDVDRSRILHLFAGFVEPDDWTRVDLVLRTTSARRFLKADVQKISRYFRKRQFDLFLADPPYTPKDAEKYETPMPNAKAVLHEVAKIAKRGSFLVWLSTSLPMYTKREWDFVGAIGIVRSTNHRYRIAAIFRRV